MNCKIMAISKKRIILPALLWLLALFGFLLLILVFIFLFLPSFFLFFSFLFCIIISISFFVCKYIINYKFVDYYFMFFFPFLCFHLLSNLSCQLKIMFVISRSRKELNFWGKKYYFFKKDNFVINIYLWVSLIYYIPALIFWGHTAESFK